MPVTNSNVWTTLTLSSCITNGPCVQLELIAYGPARVFLYLILIMTERCCPIRWGVERLINCYNENNHHKSSFIQWQSYASCYFSLFCNPKNDRDFKYRWWTFLPCIIKFSSLDIWPQNARFLELQILTYNIRNKIRIETTSITMHSHKYQLLKQWHSFPRYKKSRRNTWSHVKW